MMMLRREKNVLCDGTAPCHGCKESGARRRFGVGSFAVRADPGSCVVLLHY
jgi:hypothetical protein